MIELIREWLAPYYLDIKFVHLLAVMVWVWSTALGYAYFLVPIFKAWRRNPDDQEIIELRNWAIERFDHGVIYEHIAFPIILLTGPLLYIVGGWSTNSNWILLKILIVCFVMIPIEVMDYYLSHFGGNKERIRASGDMEKYDRHVNYHWMFFLISSPPIMVFSVIVIFLAVAKPF